MATAVQQATTPPVGTPPPLPAGSNTGLSPKVQAWFDQCRAYGEAAGAGDTSLVAWFQDMVQRAFRDEIDPDMADMGTKEYQDARRRRAAMLGKRVGSGSGTADKVRASEARKMIKLGKLAQFRAANNGGLGVFNQTLKVIGDDPELKGEVAKLLLKVATEQLRKPDAPLDEDHIKQVLSPKERSDKGEGEYLNQAKKLIELAASKSTMDAHKRAALTSLNARIEAIGFKTAAQRLAEEKAVAKQKREKAAAKAAARSKK